MPALPWSRRAEFQTRPSSSWSASPFVHRSQNVEPDNLAPIRVPGCAFDPVHDGDPVAAVLLRCHSGLSLTSRIDEFMANAGVDIEQPLLRACRPDVRCLVGVRVTPICISSASTSTWLWPPLHRSTGFAIGSAMPSGNIGRGDKTELRHGVDRQVETIEARQLLERGYDLFLLGEEQRA